MGIIQKSDYIKGIQWQSERIPYPELEIKGDTYPMTWAADGEIYASCGDPLWGETHDGLDVEKFTGGPEDYRITKVDHMNAYRGWGGGGPKPSGMICVDGVLYLAFQNMNGMNRAPFSQKSQPGSDAAIVHTTPRLVNFVPSFGNFYGKPMFPGYFFGGPAFVNFGRNNENARDDYVYAVSGDQWDNGSNLRLGRVPKEHITEANMWEFVSAYKPSGEPVWSHDLAAAVPVLSRHKHISLPEMTYMAGVNRYILLTWALHSDFNPDEGSMLFIYEAPEPWGPFSLVHTEDFWEFKEFCPYCSRLPLKWVEPDGVTCWLQFSGGWGPYAQERNYYRSNVRKFRFLMK